MIYKNKRISGLNMYKIKGAKSYILVEDDTVLNMPIGTMTALAPIVEVDSNDAEHINKIIHRLRVNGGCGFMASWQVSWSYLTEDCYKVSWAKVPKAWQGLYESEIVYRLMTL
jgi:hypothetical protein